MAQALLKAVDIEKNFAGVRALKGVSLEIMPGEIHCLAGENGCGKSTLIKVISGVHPRDGGTLEFNGKAMDNFSPIDAIMAGIQVIYQDFAVFPNLTVMENLALNTELSSKRKIVSKKRMRKIAEEAIAKINFKVDLDALVGTLSVAEKQMVAISRALMFNAKLIIMDEPTTALTKKEVDALFVTVRQLRDSGIAIMFISHKTDEIFEISDDVCIMRNGKNVYTGLTADLTRKQFTYYLTGRDIEDDYFVPKNISAEPVLEVKGLNMGSKLKDINFDLRKGEILGVTGLLGSGRTELALTLFGLAKPTSGQIILNGKDVKIPNPIAAQKLRIGYVPEDRLTEGLCMAQPIADNITLSSLKRLSNSIGLLKKKDIYTDADKWVTTFSIATDDARKNASTLSGGNQQKIVLSKWLSNDLDVLILNGPTVGVDVGAKQDIHALVHELANDGLAVIIISDDLPEVVVNCNRVIVMKEGAIVGEMTGDAISEDNIHKLIR